jgi:hypothetical protein
MDEQLCHAIDQEVGNQGDVHESCVYLLAKSPRLLKFHTAIVFPRDHQHLILSAEI